MTAQGSLITGYVMVRLQRDRRKSGEPLPQVISCGSPLDAIYGEFFPKSLEGRICRPTDLDGWHNVYFDTDYVGRELGLGGGRERSLGFGGHTQYFSDKRFAVLVLGTVLRREETWTCPDDKLREVTMRSLRFVENACSHVSSDVVQRIPVPLDG